jgi:hypothetical protein
MSHAKALRQRDDSNEPLRTRRTQRAEISLFFGLSPFRAFVTNPVNHETAKARKHDMQNATCSHFLFVLFVSFVAERFFPLRLRAFA